jgi:tRNA pseudouridine13 synthase
MNRVAHLPYLTSGLPGIGGVMREKPEDFVVEEVPAYEPCGQGEHVMAEIEKSTMTTHDAIREIARALGVDSRDIGYAGLKDKFAVTRQWLTIPGVDPQVVMNLQIARLRVLSVDRHRNKLRPGHLRGNRFVIRVCGVEPTWVVRVRSILDVIERLGMPNYFGEQRFGRRDDNDRLGAAILRGDADATVGLLLGTPDEACDPPRILEARRAFEAGDLTGSLEAWPGACLTERRVLHRLIETGSTDKALRALDNRTRKLWVSALQSRIFNAVVAERIGSLDRLDAGDFAHIHASGAGFVVEDAEREQPRADRFEISATGPMLGTRMTMPRATALAREMRVLASHGMSVEALRGSRDAPPGERRPLRVRPENVVLRGGRDERGGYVQVAFTLPAGSFATTLMREVMKSDAVPPESEVPLQLGDD